MTVFIPRIRSLEPLGTTASYRDTAKFNNKTVINTRRRPPERVLSTVLIATVAVVAVVIENRPRKGATGR